MWSSPVDFCLAYKSIYLRLSCRTDRREPPALDSAWLLKGSVSSIAASERLPLLPSSPIPQCEFDPIAYANLVVDFSEMVPDDVFADLEFLGNFFIFESLGH